MVDFGVPYAMDGTTIPGEGLRRQSQRDAGAGSGVARPGDLKVTQMNTPGTGVRIAAGDDIIQCRAPGRDRESYSTPNFSAQDWMGDAGTGIPGTGSGSGRRDMIIHEILDPSLPRHYTPQEQWPAGAYSKISVVPGVAASAKTVADVPALNDVTCYELTAINWPAATATITNAMLEDLRVVHTPFSARAWRTLNLSVLQRLSATTAYPTGGQTWPSEFTGEVGKIKIPERATHARIRMDWGSVRFIIATQGLLWVQVGQNTHPDVQRTRAMSFDAAATSREGLFIADTIPIPASMRGTEQWFFPRGNLSAAISADTQRPYVNTSSGIVLDVEFFEDTV